MEYFEVDSYRQGGRDMARTFRWAASYFGLLIIQTVAASSLFWMILPLFGRMISQPGAPQELELWRLAVIAFGVLALQFCYWVRVRCVPIYVPFQSMVVGHIMLFSSRASFFIAGAFFSVTFFRHVPELEVLPPLGQSAAKAVVIIFVLFSLFCYSLELERLGKALDGNSG